MNFEDLARSITLGNGRVLAEARGELRRAIENVEAACSIPTMMMGGFSEEIAVGIDEYMIRQPVVDGYEDGFFIRPSILDYVRPQSTVACTEIFGPVITLIRLDTVDRALEPVIPGCTGIWRVCTSAAGRRRASSGMRRKPATSGSISGWPRRWLSPLSADGKRASSEPCTVRRITRSSFLPKPKS